MLHQARNTLLADAIAGYEHVYLLSFAVTILAPFKLPGAVGNYDFKTEGCFSLSKVASSALGGANRAAVLTGLLLLSNSPLDIGDTIASVGLIYLSWCRMKFFGGSCNAFGLLPPRSPFLSVKTGLALGKGGVPALTKGGVENFSCKCIGRLLKTGVVVDLGASEARGASTLVSATASPEATGELANSAPSNASALTSVRPIPTDSWLLSPAIQALG